MATSTEIAAAVAEIVGRSGHTTKITQAIEFALEAIQQRHDFRVAYTFPSDVAITILENNCTAVIPAGYLRLMSVALVRGDYIWPVDIKTLNWIHHEYPRIGSRSWCGCEIAGVFLFRPDPVTGDKVRFIVINPLAFNGTSTEAPAGLSKAITAYAASYVFDALEIPESAKAWGQRYEIALRLAIISDVRGNLNQKSDQLDTRRDTLDDLLGEGPQEIP